jgi:hypothetical protein
MGMFDYSMDHEVDPSCSQLLSFCLGNGQGQAMKGMLEGQANDAPAWFWLLYPGPWICLLCICLFGIGISLYVKEIKENDFQGHPGILLSFGMHSLRVLWFVRIQPYCQGPSLGTGAATPWNPLGGTWAVLLPTQWVTVQAWEQL